MTVQCPDADLRPAGDGLQARLRAAGRNLREAQIDNLLALFPKNFYDLTLDQLNAIRDAVAAQYNFQDVKDIL